MIPFICKCLSPICTIILHHTLVYWSIRPNCTTYSVFIFFFLFFCSAYRRRHHKLFIDDFVLSWWCRLVKMYSSGLDDSVLAHQTAPNPRGVSNIHIWNSILQRKKCFIRLICQNLLPQQTLRLYQSTVKHKFLWTTDAIRRHHVSHRWTEKRYQLKSISTCAKIPFTRCT